MVVAEEVAAAAAAVWETATEAVETVDMVGPASRAVPGPAGLAEAAGTTMTL